MAVSRTCTCVIVSINSRIPILPKTLFYQHTLNYTRKFKQQRQRRSLRGLKSRLIRRAHLLVSSVLGCICRHWALALVARGSPLGCRLLSRSSLALAPQCGCHTKLRWRHPSRRGGLLRTCDGCSWHDSGRDGSTIHKPIGVLLQRRLKWRLVVLLGCEHAPVAGG